MQAKQSWGLLRPSVHRIACLTISVPLSAWPGGACAQYCNAPTDIFRTTTTFRTDAFPTQLVLADVTGDRVPDLVLVATAGSFLPVLPGLGDGRFGEAIPAELGAGVLPAALIAGDFDSNGTVDLVTANRSDGTVTVLLNFGAANFQSPRTIEVSPFATNARAIEAVDVDSDGDLDLLVSFGGLSSLGILRNDGSATFTFSPVSTVSANDIAVADLDGDNDADVALATPVGPQIYINESGSLIPRPPLAGGETDAVLLDDFDGDGSPDLIFTAEVMGDAGGQRVVAVSQNFNGAFAPPLTLEIAEAPTAMSVSDVNRDGAADIVLVSSVDAGGLATVIAGGDARVLAVEERFEIPWPLDPPSVLTADIDGDGDADLVTSAELSIAVTLGVDLPGFGVADTLETRPAASALEVGDVNQDGLLDLVIAETEPQAGGEDSSAFTVRLGSGAGVFGPAVLFEEASRADRLAVGDFDGVLGDDVLLFDNQRRTATLFPSNGSQAGLFSAEQVFDPFGPPIFNRLDDRLVAFGQVDGQLGPDLVAANQQRRDLVVLRNIRAVVDGGDVYRQPQLIVRDQSSAPIDFVLTADMTVDGLDDIVAFNAANEIEIYPAFGTGPVFDPPFVSEVDGFSASQDEAIVPFDADDDGDTDFVRVSGPAGLEVLVNDGTLRFQRLDTDQVGENQSNATIVAATDFDSDGDTDLVLAGEFSSGLEFMTNVGIDPATFLPTFVSTDATTVAPQATGLVVADLDLDGVEDLVAVQEFTGALSVLRGNGDGTFSQLAPLLSVQQPSSLSVGDYTGDGLPDVAVVSEDLSQLAVLAGLGGGLFGAPEVVTFESDNPMVFSGNVDDEGGDDLVFTSFGDEVTVFRSTGGGPTSFRDPVVQRLEQFRQPFQVERVFPLSLDPFTPPAVLTSGFAPNPVVFRPDRPLLEGGDVLGQPVELPLALGLIVGADLFDVSGDGLDDLVIVPTSGQPVVMEANVFGPLFGEPIDFDAPISVSQSTSVEIGDVDANGTVDFALAEGSLEFVLQELDGTFRTEFVNDDTQPTIVALTDLDRDGDLDAITGSDSAGIEIISNPGTDEDGNQEEFASSGDTGIAGAATDLVVADLDGDGDDDVAALSPASRTLSLALNQSVQTNDFSSEFLPSGVDFLDASLWRNGDPSGEVARIGVFFNDAFNPFPDTRGLTMLEDGQLRALGIRADDVSLNLRGFDLNIAGAVRASGNLGIDIGVEACGLDFGFDGTSGFVELANTVNNNPSTVTTPSLSIGRALPSRDPGVSDEWHVALEATGPLTLAVADRLVVGDLHNGVLEARSGPTAIEYGRDDSDQSDVFLGIDARGFFDLQDGTELVSVGPVRDFVLGRDPAGDGRLRLSGATWSHDGRDLFIGGTGVGYLLSNFARVDTNLAGRFEVAASPGSSGVLAVVNTPVDAPWRNTGAPLVLRRGGVLAGDGVIESTNGVFNGGAIDPGSENSLLDLGIPRIRAPRTLTLRGPFEQREPESNGRSGSYVIDVEQSPLVLRADELFVEGRAALAGAAIVASVQGTPSIGDRTRPVLLASEFVPEADAFDVVNAPVFEALDPSGASVAATLVAVRVTDQVIPGSGLAASGFALEVVPLTDLVFGGLEFEANGPPNDAALGDVTGDGIADLVIATPSIDGSPSGFVALLEGAEDGSDFTFNAVSLYADPTEVDSPIAIEVGDFDGDGKNEVAFASRGDAGQSNDVHVLEVVSSTLVDSVLDRIDIDSGSTVSDLTVLDVDPVAGSTITSVTRNNMSSGGKVVFSTRTGTGFATCDIPVEGDPDSGDPIDIDAASIGRGSDGFGEGVAVTVAGTNEILILVNDDEDPALWSRLRIRSGENPGEVRAGDLDGDGLPDLAVVNQDAGSLTIVRNTTAQGTASFAPPVEIPSSDSPVSIALADIDDDSDLDLVIVASEDGTRVVQQLRNTTTAAGTIAIAGAETTPDQPTGTPVLVRSADLDNSTVQNPDGPIADDFVVLVDPGLPGLGNAPRGPNAMHRVSLSSSQEACLADVNGDGMLNGADFNAWLTAFATGAQAADQNEDGVLNGADFNAWLTNFAQGCE